MVPIHHSNEIRPHICFVLADYFDFEKHSVGGAELQMRLLAQEFCDRGYRISFVYHDHVRGPENKRVSNGQGWDLCSFSGSQRFKFLWGFKMQDALRRVNADIYYQRGVSSLTFGTAWYVKKYRKQFVWACANLSDCDPKLWFKVRSRDCRNAFRCLGRYVIAGVEWVLARRGIETANRVICQTKEQQTLFESGSRIPRDRLKVVPNGHYLPPVSVSEKKDSPPIVLWLGSVKLSKRPELFLEVARLLSHVRCQFILAGPIVNKKRYSRILEEKQRELKNFQYLGPLDYDDVSKTMRRASFLVNTSLAEGFPNTFIEAWIHRTPVVTLDHDPDGVIQKYNLGCHAGSISQMVEYIEKTIGNAEALATMGENGLRYVRKYHDIGKTASLLDKELVEMFVAKQRIVSPKI